MRLGVLDYVRLSSEYATYHRIEGNRRAHALGIPLIVFAIVKWTQIGSFFPLAALVLPVYFLWSRRLGWIMTAFVSACAALSAFMPAWTAWAAFLAGWAFQAYGHVAHEKNSPALLDNLAHALIGPAFVIEKLTGKCRLR